jgi:hypothetical protein
VTPVVKGGWDAEIGGDQLLYCASLPSNKSNHSLFHLVSPRTHLTYVVKVYMT